MIKRFIIALLLVVLVCGGLIGFNLFRDRKIEEFFASMPQPAVTISATEAAPRTWQPGIEAIGTARAAQGVDVATQTSGVVEEVLFQANERVSQGQVLVHIADTVERAQLSAAQAEVDLAQAQLDRLSELRERGVTSQANYDEAVAQLASARSALDRLRAEIDLKEVTAPFAGVIGIPRIDDGQYVQPGTVVATLQDLDTMRVDFTVPEQRSGDLAIDQPVAVGIRADEMRWQGRIIGIDPKVDPETRLISVRAEVANTNGALRPGQFTRVRVDLPPEAGVLVLPQTAVVTSLYGDYVYRLRRGEGKDDRLRAEQVFVSTGRRNAGLVEITDGISPGETIVTAGQNKLQNGAPVEVDNTVDPAQIADRTGTVR